MGDRSHGKSNRDLAAYLGEKLDVPGDDLATVSARAGRVLPRRLRREADYLVQAETLRNHPKLRHLIDDDRARKADRRLRAHVRNEDPAKARTDRRLGWLAGLAFNLLLFAALVIVLLYWRGFVGPG